MTPNVQAKPAQVAPSAAPASAYTHGADPAFAAGGAGANMQSGGDHLLAHELAHVVQQGAVPATAAPSAAAKQQ